MYDQRSAGHLRLQQLQQIPDNPLFVCAAKLPLCSSARNAALRMQSQR